MTQDLKPVSRFLSFLECSMTDRNALLEGSALVPVRRFREGAFRSRDDLVAEEVPVALVFNGISHAVMMATPTDLEVFATGFALSEGIVAHRREIHDLEVCEHEEGMEVQLQIAQAAFSNLKQHRRALTGRTGCGVCGIESIAMLDLEPEPVGLCSVLQGVGHAEIARVLAALPAAQPLMQATGCAHAAAWCAPDGTLVRVFEDVGRHNALDKLLGWRAMDGTDGAGFVFMSSRASYELVRKAARCNVGLLATISAPTSLAVRLAHESGIRLLSFCRDSGFVEY